MMRRCSWLVAAALLTACDGETHSIYSASPACERFTTDRLTSPSTAEFQPFTQQDIRDLGDGRYVARFYVDAQNQLGAMVRGNVYCEVHHDAERGGYVLDSLTITQ